MHGRQDRGDAGSTGSMGSTVGMGGMDSTVGMGGMGSTVGMGSMGSTGSTGRVGRVPIETYAPMAGAALYAALADGYVDVRGRGGWMPGRIAAPLRPARSHPRTLGPPRPPPPPPPPRRTH